MTKTCPGAHNARRSFITVVRTIPDCTFHVTRVEKVYLRALCRHTERPTGEI